MATDTQLRATFAERIKRRRERRGLTQQAMANQLGIRQSYLSELEQGEHSPRLSTVLRFAAFFDVSPATLLG